MHVQDILSDLIKIKSVNPPGGETEVAVYLKKLLGQAGIPSEIIEPAPGRGSLLSQVGEGEKRLLYLSHTDVVPAAESWDFDPFSGEIREGHILGRGALDCKGLVAAEVYSLMYVAKNFSLKGKLIFGALADEEVGGAMGIQYLLQSYPDKLRADFAVNEGGEEPLKIGDKVVYFIQTGEKGTVWTRLKSQGVSCHGSVPTLGDNAVVKLAKGVERLGRFKPRVKLIPEVKTLLQSLAELKGMNIRVSPGNVDQVIESFEDKAFREYLRAITRMTVSPNMIQGGVKTNIVPDSCEAEVDIRILPGQERGFVERELKRRVGADIAIDIPDFNPASFSPVESPHYKLLHRTIKEVFGEVASLPCVSSGATDSRFLRRAGTPAYGLSLMDKDFDPALRRTIHARNERIDLKSLSATTEFLIKLARNYLVG